MRRRGGSLAATVLVAAMLLAGCASTPAEMSRDASAELQADVVLVAESAAAGDAAAALVHLDELQQRLESAVSTGEVSDERAAAIRSAIDLVRADLQPAPQPTPSAEPTEPVDDDDDDAPANDNSGPGNNSGKGSDKGKGKDKDD